jgi:Tfp pilus assembly protein FimT
MSINKLLRNRVATSSSGYTAIELLTIVLVLGIVSAIAAPAWLMFINNQRLKVSLDRAHSAMVTARSNAKRDKVAWQATFREVGNTVQVAIHPSDITPARVPASQWKSLEPEIKIHTNDTTLLPISEDNKYADNGTLRRARFNYKGCPVYNIDDECGMTSYRAKGNLTLFHPKLKNSERCIIITTILGHKRISQRQRKANDKGRFCY